MTTSAVSMECVCPTMCSVTLWMTVAMVVMRLIAVSNITVISRSPSKNVSFVGPLLYLLWGCLRYVPCRWFLDRVAHSQWKAYTSYYNALELQKISYCTIGSCYICWPYRGKIWSNFIGMCYNVLQPFRKISYHISSLNGSPKL